MAVVLNTYANGRYSKDIEGDWHYCVYWPSRMGQLGLEMGNGG